MSLESSHATRDGSIRDHAANLPMVHARVRSGTDVVLKGSWQSFYVEMR